MIEVYARFRAVCRSGASNRILFAATVERLGRFVWAQRLGHKNSEARQRMTGSAVIFSWLGMECSAERDRQEIHVTLGVTTQEAEDVPLRPGGTGVLSVPLGDTTYESLVIAADGSMLDVFHQSVWRIHHFVLEP